MNNLKKLSKLGNYKIGKDTIIFNMSSANNCPSDKKGYCKNSKICYAKKAERMYPSVLPYREKQANYWANISPNNFVKDLLSSYQNKINKGEIKYLRFNESGDMANQADLIKLNYIANILELYDIKVYIYTANIYLNFDLVSNNLAINLSNVNRDNFIFEEFTFNTFTAINKGTFVKKSKKDKLCIADCSKCNLCKSNKGLNIFVIKH